MIGSRTRSREIALQVLYSCDQSPSPEPQNWEMTLDDAEVSDEVREFARELVAGVISHRGELDGLIAESDGQYPDIEPVEIKPGESLCKQVILSGDDIDVVPN